MPLFLILVEDGNGESDVVTILLAASEEEKTIEEMTKVFKKHNPQWVEIKTIITDKEFTERSVFGRAFPDALLLICLFNVSRTFRR